MSKILPGCLLFFILLTGCQDETIFIDYTIRNGSDRTIWIRYQKTVNDSIDSSLITDKQSLRIHTETVEDKSAKKYLNKLEQIPFEFIEITDLDGNFISCPANSLTCWTYNEDNDSGTAIISLGLYQSSFNP